MIDLIKQRASKLEAVNRDAGFGITLRSLRHNHTRTIYFSNTRGMLEKEFACITGMFDSCIPINRGIKKQIDVGCNLMRGPAASGVVALARTRVIAVAATVRALLRHRGSQAHKAIAPAKFPATRLSHD